MLVLDDGPAECRPVPAAHSDDRKLAPELDERFEDEGLVAEPLPCRIDIEGVTQNGLTFAVIAAAARLQHCGQADDIDRLVQRILVIDRPERSRRDAK